MDQRTNTFANFNHYRMDGAQFHVDIQPTANLTLRLNYTYLNAKNLGGGGVDQLQYRPRHQLALQATYRPTRKLTVYAAAYDLADQVYYAKHGPAQKSFLSNYLILNLHISYAFTGALVGYVGARNLLDRNYMQSYGFPAPGRIVYAGISTIFKL